MQLIMISDSKGVLDGLDAMMAHYVAMGETVRIYVDIPTALLIVEIARRAEDRAEWFPRGKWATIQSIQERIKAELDISISMNEVS